MTFANPALLVAGLFAVAVPILIHILMRRRRKPVSWGAMEWLLEAYRQQRRRMRFEQLLLLALRCLLVALVGLALAKPLFGDRAALEAQRPRTLAILLDDSLTAQVATPGAAPALDAHKAAALALLDQLDPARGDRAGLILLAGPAQPLVAPASSDLAEVKRLIGEVRATDARADLSGALEAVSTLVPRDQPQANERDLVLALLSDLREGSLDLATPWRAAPNVSRVLTSGPAPQPVANVSLASLEPLTSLVLAADAESTLPLRLALSRFGDSTEQRTTIRAWIVNAASLQPTSTPPVPPANAARAEVSWSSGQRDATVTISAPLPQGSDTAGDWIALAQIDQDAIPADNWIARPLEARASLTIALVGPASSSGGSLDRFTPKDWLALALAPAQTSILAASSVRITRLEARDFVGVSASDAVPGVLRGVSGIVVTEPQLLDASGWRALRAAAASGAMIMIVPPEAEQAQTWTDALRETLATPWQLARNARDLPQDAGAIAPAATASGDDDLLSVLRPELEELTRASRVARIIPVESGLAPAHTLLALRDGTPLILAARVGISAPRSGASNVAAGPTSGLISGPVSGWIVLWLAPPSLAWTDLPAKPLMVPLVQELVRQGIGRGVGRRDFEAGPLLAPPPASAVEFALAQPFVAPATSPPAIPLTRAQAPLAARLAGIWRARDAAGAFLSPAWAINPAHSAGDTTPIPRDQVERWILGPATAGELPRQVTFLNSGQSPQLQANAGNQNPSPLRDTDRSDAWMFSFWLLIAAATIALVEAVLARWFSHARIRTDDLPKAPEVRA